MGIWEKDSFEYSQRDEANISFYLVSKIVRDVKFSPGLCLSVGGFYIFRKSNSEKNAFRRNPSDPKLSRKFCCRLEDNYVMLCTEIMFLYTFLYWPPR